MFEIGCKCLWQEIYDQITYNFDFLCCFIFEMEFYVNSTLFIKEKFDNLKIKRLYYLKWPIETKLNSEYTLATSFYSNFSHEVYSLVAFNHDGMLSWAGCYSTALVHLSPVTWYRRSSPGIDEAHQELLLTRVNYNYLWSPGIVLVY